MSLQQEIDDTKVKLAEALEAEKAAEELPEEEPEVKEEPKEEEKPAEEPAKEEPKEEKPDDAAFARLRREAAASKKRADEAEAKLSAPAKEEAAEVEEVPPIITSMINDYQKGLAEREFKIYESQIKDPHYAAISNEYANAMSASIKMQNPRKTNAEIAEMTKDAIIRKAGEYQRAGFANPVEELLHDAKELGFTGKSAVEEKKEPSPDMKKVAENRRRNAGTAGTSGESKQDLTRRHIAENGITGAEWMKLSPEAKKALMYPQE